MCCIQPVSFILMMIVINPLQNAVTLQTFVPVVATALTAFTQLVNPLIPPMFLRSAAQSASRLEEQGVPCLEVEKIAQAGKFTKFYVHTSQIAVDTDTSGSESSP